MECEQKPIIGKFENANDELQDGYWHESEDVRYKKAPIHRGF